MESVWIDNSMRTLVLVIMLPKCGKSGLKFCVKASYIPLDASEFFVYMFAFHNAYDFSFRGSDHSLLPADLFSNVDMVNKSCHYYPPYTHCVKQYWLVLCMSMTHEPSWSYHRDHYLDF